MAAARHPLLILLTACLISLLSTVGISLPYPILAPMFVNGSAEALTHFMGLPPKVLLGIALAINPLGILLGSAVLGSLSDRYGRRKVMLGSLALAVLGYSGTALALIGQSYPLFVLFRFATGICEGNIAIARAVAADLHPAVDRHRAFGWMNSAIFLGWLLGPLLGGLTLPFGASVPFWCAGLAMLPCLVLLLLVMPETAPVSARAGGFWATLREENAFELLKAPGIPAIFTLQFFWTLGLNAFYEFYPLWLVERLGYGSRPIAFATAAMCVLMTATSSLLWPKAGRRFRALSSALGAGLVFTGLFWSLPFAPGFATVVIIVLSGMPLAVYGAALPVYCSERFEALGQGRVMGMLTTTFCLANTLIAFAGGFIALLDTRLVLWLGAGLCSIALLLLQRLRREVLNPVERAS